MKWNTNILHFTFHLANCKGNVNLNSPGENKLILDRLLWSHGSEKKLKQHISLKDIFFIFWSVLLCCEIKFLIM